MDAIETFKDNEKKGWATFVPTEIFTCGPAARLVVFAGIGAGDSVLDVGCGTGVVAVSAARFGAHVTGLDLTPELLVRARENAALVGADVAWHEGDVEALPFADASFDAVVSQFGHMFAPRPDVATREMLRVLKPGGTLAFATWPPDFFTGTLIALVARYLPPVPPGIAPPYAWGSPEVVRERLGGAVRDLVFERALMRSMALSPQHIGAFFERNVAPVMKVAQLLANDPAKLAGFRRELDALLTMYFDPAENCLRQDYLLTRATKAS